MTRTIITAVAISLIAGPALADTPDQSGMLRTSVAQSLGSSTRIDRAAVADLSLIELSALRHIVESGTSEGQKAFRARAFLDRTAN